MEEKSRIRNEEVEKELLKIKEKSKLRSKYLSLFQEELEKDDIHSLINNKELTKLELKLKKKK